MHRITISLCYFLMIIGVNGYADEKRPCEQPLTRTERNLECRRIKRKFESMRSQQLKKPAKKKKPRITKTRNLLFQAKKQLLSKEKNIDRHNYSEEDDESTQEYQWYVEDENNKTDTEKQYESNIRRALLRSLKDK